MATPENPSRILQESLESLWRIFGESLENPRRGNRTSGTEEEGRGRSLREKREEWAEWEEWEEWVE